VLAEVCRREFGVPERSANVERAAAERDWTTTRQPDCFAELASRALAPTCWSVRRSVAPRSKAFG
jgi:hypothetical protein